MGARQLPGQMEETKAADPGLQKCGPVRQNTAEKETVEK